MRKRSHLLTSLLLTLLLFLSAAVTIKANILDEFINGAKNIVSPSAQGELKIDSDITFAKDGDLDKNGVFDAGDYVTFSFKIKNLSDKDYPFSVLKTKIPSDSINYIRRVKGVTSVRQGEDTIEFPNIYLNKNETLDISFDATLTYTKQTKSIEVITEFYDNQKNKIKDTPKKTLNIKAFLGESIKGEMNLKRAEKESTETKEKEKEKEKEVKQETASSAAKIIEEVVKNETKEVKESTSSAEDLNEGEKRP